MGQPTWVRGATPMRLGAGAAVLALALTTFTTVGPEETSVTAIELPLPRAAAATPTDPATPADTSPSVPVDLGLELRGIPAIPGTSAGRDDLPAFEPPSPVQLPDEVDTLPADVVVRSEDGPLDVDELAEPLEQASHVAAVASLRAEGVGPTEASRELDLLAVDPLTFRPLTPEITAGAVAVWERLLAGDVLVAHEVAESLDLELGGDLLLRTEEGDELPVRVGAFAANGTPPLADVLIPFSLAEDLGTDLVNGLVLSAGDDAEDVVDELEGLVDGDVQLLRDPEPVAPQPQQQATRGQLEAFEYTSHADGRITIHGDWIARNIVAVQLPGMPATRCHRAMAPQLVAAVEELIARDLYGHLDPAQFAGCFMPRHIDWSPAKPLSMHAWGLAIDFNTRDNPLGARPVMDPQVVAVFEKWGFSWGGRWRRPDGMHFELARIVSPG